MIQQKTEFPGKWLSQTNPEYVQSVLKVQNVLNVKELRSTCSKGLEDTCQNTLKDKPAFIKRLIKVLVARNLFLVHSSSCRNSRLVGKPLHAN